MKPDQAPLRRRLRELAATKVHAGYLQLHVYLRREGWKINKKRVYRLYVEEGQSLRRKRPKRRRSAARRIERPQPAAPNEIWAMDFMHDTLADGKTARVLTVIDTHTRECVALEAGSSFSGAEVGRILSSAAAIRGPLPRSIRVDNGTEFTSKALDAWAYWNHVELDFSRPGKPADNAYAESFNATVRRQCASRNIGFATSQMSKAPSADGRRSTTTIVPTAVWDYKRRPAFGPDSLKPRTRTSPQTHLSSGSGTGRGPPRRHTSDGKQGYLAKKGGEDPIPAKVEERIHLQVVE